MTSPFCSAPRVCVVVVLVRGGVWWVCVCVWVCGVEWCEDVGQVKNRTREEERSETQRDR